MTASTPDCVPPEPRASRLRALPGVIAAVLTACLAAGCGDEKHSYVRNVGETTPTVSTADVSTFVSDSGYTRYHITSDRWDMYEDAAQPYWLFPTGLFLEQYDDNMKRAASIVCDSARFLSQRRLWQLDGNVVMVNTLRDTFLTQQLFWDQLSRKVYSDSFIHIVKAGRVLEGYGFNSNENMTSYSITNPSAIIPVERTATQASAAPPDTSAPATVETYSPTMRPAPMRASRRRAITGE